MQVTGTGSNQMITTIDPRLPELGFPQYPPLPGNVDPQRIEEIRRTVYVGNLDPTVTPEQVLNFFAQVGSSTHTSHTPTHTIPHTRNTVHFSHVSTHTSHAHLFSLRQWRR